MALMLLLLPAVLTRAYAFEVKGTILGSSGLYWDEKIQILFSYYNSISWFETIEQGSIIFLSEQLY